MRLFYYAVSLLALPSRRNIRGPGRSRRRGSRRAVIAGLVAVAGAAAVAGCGAATGASGHAGTSGAGSTAAQQNLAAANPNLDPGTSLHGIPAPDFSLTNQFGQRMSLSDFRGKVVILAFTDSQCTTVCPLTTQSMLAAKQLLGRAGSQVQLVGVDANPAATKVSDVLAYSRAHQMVNQWDFLTGSDHQLAAVWKAYHIYTQIVKGQVDHTPALYIIDARGREQKLYLTT
ncbi:MAG TPA: SCO family protein, partial [Streptosporangiaceae bacterium]|nr:SCO family protein [Streptosporangiaceae bacterium]